MYLRDKPFALTHHTLTLLHYPNLFIIHGTRHVPISHGLIYLSMYCRDKPFALGPDVGYTSENEAMTILSRAKMNAFDMGTHGQFFWNFRTEFEPRWSYLEAVRLNWLPKVTTTRTRTRARTRTRTRLTILTRLITRILITIAWIGCSLS